MGCHITAPAHPPACLPALTHQNVLDRNQIYWDEGDVTLALLRRPKCLPTLEYLLKDTTCRLRMQNLYIITATPAPLFHDPLFTDADGFGFETFKMHRCASLRGVHKGAQQPTDMQPTNIPASRCNVETTHYISLKENVSWKVTPEEESPEIGTPQAVAALIEKALQDKDRYS